jgi:hypothetical protein
MNGEFANRITSTQKEIILQPREVISAADYVQIADPGTLPLADSQRTIFSVEA